MPKKPRGGTTGRPSKKSDAKLDWKQAVEDLCPWYTAAYIAEKLGVDEDTLINWIKSEYHTNFSGLRDQKRQNQFSRLAKVQLEVAMEDRNPTMLVWCGKQYLGQTDKQDIKQNIEAKVQSIEEYLKDKEK